MAAAAAVRRDLAALERLRLQMKRNGELARQVACIISSSACVLTTGLGKSAPPAMRLASTLRSIGCRAHWVHAGEWGHGDMASLMADDVIVGFSHSGRTPEMLDLQRRLRAATKPPFFVAIAGGGSPLVAAADLAFAVPPLTDLELLGNVPTASVIAQESIANAIVAEVVSVRGTSPQDYLRTHPSGALGEQGADAESLEPHYR